MTEPSITLIDDPERVAETLSSIRRSILTALDQPDSATGLARRLGTTRQRVNYHLRALEAAELVEVEELRQRRGLTERVMRRTSDVVLIDPVAFETAGLHRNDVVGLGGVVSVSSDLIRQAAAVAGVAGNRGERVAAASLDTEIRVASPSALRALLDDMAAVITRHDSGTDGLLVRVATSILPGLELP